MDLQLRTGIGTPVVEHLSISPVLLDPSSRRNEPRRGVGAVCWAGSRDLFSVGSGSGTWSDSRRLSLFLGQNENGEIL